MKFLYDFLPIVLFFVVYKSYDDSQQGLLAATAVLIVTSVIQLAWTWFRTRQIERMPLITVILGVILGGATLLLQDEVYIKWKPSVVNWLFGVAFLGSQFIGKKTLIERMLGNALDLPSEAWVRLNLAWTVFFIAMGLVNLYVAFNYDTDTWVNFKLFGMMGLTLVFVVLQALYIARYIKVEPETNTTNTED